MLNFGTLILTLLTSPPLRCCLRGLKSRSKLEVEGRMMVVIKRVEETSISHVHGRLGTA